MNPVTQNGDGPEAVKERTALVLWLRNGSTPTEADSQHPGMAADVSSLAKWNPG
jgi:hypothetical protein